MSDWQPIETAPDDERVLVYDAETKRQHVASRMTAVEYRMAWIKESVEIFGQINREHICRKFQVSLQQAAADIKLVLGRWPDLMSYNKSSKRYERNGD